MVSYKKITTKKAKELAEKYQINLEVVPFDEWKNGLEIELEHKDLTKSDLDKTAIIAIAHLVEDPRYYFHLEILEKKREKFWKKHGKPSIFL